MQHLNYLINQKCLLFNYTDYPNSSSRQSLGGRKGKMKISQVLLSPLIIQQCKTWFNKTNSPRMTKMGLVNTRLIKVNAYASKALAFSTA